MLELLWLSTRSQMIRCERFAPVKLGRLLWSLAVAGGFLRSTHFISFVAGAGPMSVELIHVSPGADSALRWADGTLKGLKVFQWRDGEVWSPLHRVAWPGGILAAREFYAEDGQLRGKGGIHAIWPPGTKDNDEALREFESYIPRRSFEFTALVSGWGRCVMGDVGWRAEHARIRVVMQAPRHKVRDFRAWCLENNVKESRL